MQSLPCDADVALREMAHTCMVACTNIAHLSGVVQYFTAQLIARAREQAVMRTSSST
jgi:hypothetical protein